MPDQPDRFDLIVVGAGSGTTVSAAAAQAGWKVAIIEAGRSAAVNRSSTMHVLTPLARAIP